MIEIRKTLEDLFQVGVAAADPYAAVSLALKDMPQPTQIISFGKAARKMAAAAMAHFPGVACLVVTNYENAQPLDGAAVMAAGHPIPDGNGILAANAVMAAAQTANGPLLVLISGGASALLPAPVNGISLADKAAVSQLLLAAGIDIYGMNLVRQNLSNLKGGGLALAAAPHHVTALILSDVVGDDLRVVASGPTSQAIGSLADARELLIAHNVWENVPKSVQVHLSKPNKIKPVNDALNVLIGSNTQSVRAMNTAAPDAVVITDAVIGDVKDAAAFILDRAQSGLTIWGGETTVNLRGDGRGGRNQELALRIALEAKNRGWPDGWVCLQAGTDGRDGPTDAAGAVVSSTTLARIAAAGIDLQKCLANNDSYTALAAVGDLLLTGATGTNVADIGLLFRP